MPMAIEPINGGSGAIPSTRSFELDRLASMAAFVRAVDLGSFAAAADALGISAPMVGKHVRSLETRLGVRLLNRTTRRHGLTEFGRAYHDHCRTILAEVAAADRVAEHLVAEPHGTLRIAMPVLFGRYCVVPIVLELAQRYPGLQLELALSDRLVDLADGFDLAIRTGVPADRADVMARRLARQRMVVCAAPTHLAAFGQPQSIDELAMHPAIVYRRSGTAAPWLLPQQNGTTVEVRPPSRVRMDDLAAIADAATEGMGVAWLPSWLIRDRLATGALVELLPDHPDALYDCHALWIRTPYLPRKVRVAIDALAVALPAQMARA